MGSARSELCTHRTGRSSALRLEAVLVVEAQPQVAAGEQRAQGRRLGDGLHVDLPVLEGVPLVQ